MRIDIKQQAGDFAEDKDIAAKIREKEIRPVLNRGDAITLNFTGVTLTTQSFIHALISDILRSKGESALEQLVFKGCNKGVAGLIETVVQYSLETLDDG